MKYFMPVFLICFTVFQCDSVRVNVQGWVKVGHDVMETLTHFLNKDNLKSGRRSLMYNKKDPIALVVKSAHLCQNLQICTKKMDQFIHEYIVALANLIEQIFSVINQESKTKETLYVAVLLERHIRNCLKEIRQILKKADDEIMESNEVLIWTDVIKKISVKFQTMSKTMIGKTLDNNSSKIDEFKKKLKQKAVITIVMVETRYEHKLCIEHNICVKLYHCTKSLNELLKYLKDISDDKLSEFMRHFYQLLSRTPFYDILDELTANEFQIILNDMAYSPRVSAKDVLLSVQEIVAKKLHFVDDKEKGLDILLLHMILSDMDHLSFTKRKFTEIFNTFLNHFIEWVKEGKSLEKSMKQLIMNFTNELLSPHLKDLITKLRNEVKVFLELTVDPEK